MRVSSLAFALRSAACCLALLAAGCRAATIEAETLPFHLAVVPFDVAERAVNAGDPLLHFEGGALAREFAGMLDGLTFTQVTVLALPEGVTEEELASWPEYRRERHWIDAARACGADLLLQAGVQLDPRVSTRVVGGSLGRASFEGLLKLALYTEFNTVGAGIALLLTVTGWDNDERRHRLYVGFEGTLFELGPLLDPGTEADLANRRTAIARSFQYETDRTSTFSDRQNWFGHLVSIFTLGAILPSHRATLARSLRERVAETLLAGMVEELEFRKRELLGGDDLFPFRVERLTFEPDAGAGPALSAEIALTTPTIDSMDGYRVWIDGTLFQEASFDAPTSREHGLSRYGLRVPLPAVPPTAVLRLELRDGAPRQSIRTFTLRPDRTGRWAEKYLAIRLPDASSGS